MNIEELPTRQTRSATISNNTAYCLLVLIGMGYLFPLASIIQAYDAWVHLFPNRNVEFVLSAVYMGTNLVMVLFLTFVPVSSFRKRILQGFWGQLVGLVFIPTLLFFNISEPVLFILILVSTAFEAIVTSLLDSSLLAYCAQFSDTFSHGVEFGIGLSYFVSCVYRIITKVALSNSAEVSTIVYFYAGALTILSCIISFQYLDTQVGSQYLMSRPLPESSRKGSSPQLEASMLRDQSSKELEIVTTPTSCPSPTTVPPSPTAGTQQFSLPIPPTPELQAKFSTSSISSQTPHHQSTASLTLPQPIPLVDLAPVVVTIPPSPIAHMSGPPSPSPPLVLPTSQLQPLQENDSATTESSVSQSHSPTKTMTVQDELSVILPPKTPREIRDHKRQSSFIDAGVPTRKKSMKSLSWKKQLMVIGFLLKQYYVVLTVFFVNGCLMPGMIASIPSSQSPGLESSGWFALSLLSTFAVSDLIGRFCARYESRMRCIISPERLWRTATVRNIIIVPPMILCVFKIGFGHDFWAYFWTSLFGWTNGILNVACITSVFQQCDKLLFSTEEKHFSGRLLSFVILLGLTTGAECGLGFSYLLPK